MYAVVAWELIPIGEIRSGATRASACRYLSSFTFDIVWIAGIKPRPDIFDFLNTNE
jgi:hypothetical protein